MGEVVGVTDELGGNIGGVAVLFVLRGVLEAEAGLGIRDRHPAAAATGSASRAVRRNEFGLGEDSGFFVHESFLSGDWGRSNLGTVWVHPGSFLKSVKTQGLEDTEKWKCVRNMEAVAACGYEERSFDSLRSLRMTILVG
jgi:hypothetical protein